MHDLYVLVLASVRELHPQARMTRVIDYDDMITCVCG